MTKYKAWCPDYNQDEGDGTARTAREWEGPREIAAHWAEWLDITGADYSIAGDAKTVRVLVRNLETNEVTHWHVSGEMEPRYSARSAEMPAAPVLGAA